jgi:hypothetical protein
LEMKSHNKLNQPNELNQPYISCRNLKS